MAYINGNKPIITNGLVYALDFGNTKSYNSGSNIARSMVFDPAGTTVVTGSTAIPVLTNGVLNFTGPQFVRRTGSLDSIDPNGAFTISLVAKSNTVGSLLTQNLTGKIFQIQSTPSSSNIGFNLGTGTYSRTIPGFNPSSLQHISFRYNSGSIDTFLNGIPVTSSIANASLRPTGQLNALFFSSGSNSFSGSLANLYVYNRALTPDEIYENYLVMAGRYGLPVVPKPYSIDENLYQWIQATNTTDTNTISAISTFISGLKSTGLWNKIQTIYPFVGTTIGSQTINLKEPGLYRLSLTGSFSASSTGLSPSSSTSFVDSIPGNTVYPLVNNASAHLSLLSYDTPAGNGFLGGNSTPAVGGDRIIASGSKIYHVFTNVGTSSFAMADPSITNVEVLVVAGGGAGGSGTGGGGGAGGLVYSASYAITPNTIIPVIIGQGGPLPPLVTAGQSGQNSVFNDIVAIGGGGGSSIGGPAKNGGSGGGGSTYSVNNSGSGTPGQGNDGAIGSSPNGGGGGGAGTVAILSTGGSGSYFPQYVGLNVGSPAGWFAGGGAGSTQGFANGGIGGGGFGNASGPGLLKSGVSNTGGGGGSGWFHASGEGGGGGSGIIIVSYNFLSTSTAFTGSGTGLYLTDSGITGSVNSQFTAGITGSGTIGFLTVSRTGSGVFSIHKNNVSQSIASASLGASSTDIFFNAVNLLGSGSLPLPATLAYASIGAGLTTSEVSTYYNLVSQFQTNLKRQNTLLDNYSGAAAAYSLRRIGPSGYFGPAIRVRRDSDNALRDIGFTSDGQLDTVGLLDFVGVTGSGFVQTWYDQSGNGENITANQTPWIIRSGSVVTYENKPSIYFGDPSSTRLIGKNYSTIEEFTIFTKYYTTSTGFIFSYGISDLEAGSNTLYVGAGRISLGTYINVNRLDTYTYDGTTATVFGNSVEIDSDSATDPVPDSTFNIGGRRSGAISNTNLYFQEYVLYLQNQPQYRTGVESNLNTFYKIFGSATASFDPDYQAFITATGITEPTQSAALETLVSDLKSYGLWSKMKAIYPMVTDRNNRFAQSEDFSQTWNPVSSSVSSNQTTAPNGTSTADLILDTVDTGEHYIYQTIDGTTGIVTGSEYVLSTYAKFYNTPYIAFKTNTGAQAWFDVQTGVTGSYTGSNATITNVGNGWYRCALYFTSSVATGPYNQQIHLALADNDLTFAGTGTSGSYLWGAQFENGNLLGPYRKTEGSGFTVSGSNSMLDQMKFNLKNSADTDAAFRLVYSGSWNPGYSGVRGDGSTAYADTKLKPNLIMTFNNQHYTVYKTDIRDSGTDLGSLNQNFNGSWLRLTTGSFNGSVSNNGGVDPFVVTPKAGNFILNRTTSTRKQLYKNSPTPEVKVDATPTDVQNYAIGNVFIGARNSISSNSDPFATSTPVNFSKTEIRLTTIGDGLTDYEAKALYWIVQKFQTTLGRQVY
jgi:hypothetical protein